MRVRGGSLCCKILGLFYMGSKPGGGGVEGGRGGALTQKLPQPQHQTIETVFILTTSDQGDSILTHRYNIRPGRQYSYS